MLDIIGCCGVVEMQQLRHHETSRGALTEIIEWRNDDGRGRPFILFSQSDDGEQSGNYGDRLARYIIKHKLGSVVATPAMINGNTGNNLKVWLWGIDEDALKDWADEHDVEMYNPDS